MTVKSGPGFHVKCHFLKAWTSLRDVRLCTLVIKARLRKLSSMTAMTFMP